jgi:hypothetical protein
MRTVIFGDTIYYAPESTPIENVFDIQTHDSKEHFLALIILQFVSSEGRRTKTHGFVNVDSVYDLGAAMGFQPKQVDEHMARLCAKKLIETAGRVSPTSTGLSASAVRITTVGAYHLMRLPTQFVYYDAIVTDTPILKEEFRSRIEDVADIADRLARGVVFLDYLDACFGHLAGISCGFDWVSASAACRRDIDRIRDHVT